MIQNNTENLFQERPDEPNPDVLAEYRIHHNFRSLS